MPELPEVETTVQALKRKVLKRTFLDIWTDAEKIIKKPKPFSEFKKGIIGKSIQDIKRKGKLILIELSQNKTLLIHQKLTGHLLVGKWEREGKSWRPTIKGPLDDSMNRFIHLIFWLDDDLMLALSDLRKFAKIELQDSTVLNHSQGFKEIGPEPMDRSFTFKKFKNRIERKRGRIKQVLMDQRVIAGIGNIYSDEILFKAGVRPARRINSLNQEELRKIYQATRSILKKAIEVGGDSFSDYRRPNGSRGGFNNLSKVYRREGKRCLRCGAIIEKQKIGGRSAHFCPKCQK